MSTVAVGVARRGFLTKDRGFLTQDKPPLN